MSKPSMVSERPGQLEEEMVCFKDPSEKAQRGMMKDDITTQPRLKQKGSSSSSAPSAERSPRVS